MNTIRNEIQGCIELERKSAEIYRSLGALFPEAANLFHELADLEEAHAGILNSARVRGVQNPGKEVNPASLKIIREGLRIAQHFRELIESGNLTLEKASAMSLFFQESIGETYFEVVMSSETDEEIITKLMKLFFDEERHIEKLEAFHKQNFAIGFA